jgi:hypothetical protein
MGVALGHVSAQAQHTLTGQELLAESNRIEVLNSNIFQKRWPSHFPRNLGTFHGKEANAVFLCGDLCPNMGFAVILLSGVEEADCGRIGRPIYTDFWGYQYAGCTPLVHVRGTLGERIGEISGQKALSWFVTYDGPDPGKASVETPLLIDPDSSCLRRYQRIDCFDLRDGQVVDIEGTRAEDVLEVIEIHVTSVPTKQP